MPWFKFFPDDWIRDTRNLSPEARAAYLDCLCIIYQTELPISQDDKWLAHYFHMSARKWRALRAELVTHGFLVETEAGLVNSRALSEIEKRTSQRRTNAEIAANRERKKRENCENANVINETSARKQHYIESIEIEREEREEITPPVSPPLAEKRSRGSRLPDDWELPSDWRNWTLTNCPVSTPETCVREALVFANYWQAKAGRDAVKLNWFKTWQNWSLKAFGTAPARPQSQAYGASFGTNHLQNLLAKRRAEAEARA